MKRQLIKIIAVATSILMLSTAAYALNLQNGQLIGGTGITGTYHDLSTTGVGGQYGINTAANGGTNNRICVFCHAPHFTKEIGMNGVNSTYTYMPLWNHEMSTIPTYKLYTTGSAIVGDPNDPNNPLDGIAFQAAGTLGQPGSVSKLCLSCHDGSVALSAYGMNNVDPYLQSPQGTTGQKIWAGKQIGAGGDLSNHHPIGFNYDTTAATDLEIAPDTTQLSAASGVRIKDVLINGNMECITCHDVHNSKNEAGAEKFLWKSDQHSHLCLTCHLKGVIN